MELKINKIRGRMGELNMSVAELSRKSGVCRHELTFIIKGERKPRTVTIQKICAALDIENEKIPFYFPCYVPYVPTQEESGD